MDFGTLLHVAKKNSETEKNESKYYSTKFAPPKKESKEKKLSANIQKFLQKREQEEKERQRVEREKLNNLLSKRDEKSKNKIKKMLKVTKSANKSVLDDAVNTEHTAVTMEGPDQPDQDDYGYVSTEANAFYQKYIEKVKDVKEDKGFAPSRPQSLKDLSGTKERVKAAITKEIEEKKSHTRQRTSTTATATASDSATSSDANNSVARAYTTSKNLYDPEAERREEERKKREEEQKKAKNRKPLPPPMDFQALLKLAEKKQHEPVKILVEVKKNKEPERLLTLKEKREFEERLREREARERRKRERNNEVPKNRNKEQERNERNKESSTTGGRMEPNGRIPKLNQVSSKSTIVSSSTTNSSLSKPASSSSTVTSNTIPGHAQNANNVFKKPNAPAAAYSSSVNAHPNLSSSKASNKPATISSTNLPKSTTAKSGSSSNTLSNSSGGSSNSSKNLYAPSSSSKNSQNIREFPPQQPQQKARQFPPLDVRKGSNSKSSESRRPQPAPKRRILDDDDEYDSELDDFIDDGDEEEDYSLHIKEIFGYDKSRYRDLDDDDDAGMESNFAQVQREEYISKKIGIQEDLEDMKLEAMEKKRKMIMKKRKL